MTYLNHFIIALLFLGLVACQNNPTPEADTTAIPELLDRPEQLSANKEWEKVQNLYVQHRNEIKQSADNAESRLQIAQIFIHEARVTGEHGHYYPAALDVLDAIAEDHPKKDITFRKLSMKAGILLSLHDFKQALEVAQKAVSINPYNAQIYGALVDAHVELGNYEKAVAAADKMVSIRPDLRSYARISYLREIHGQVAGALEAMEMAVQAGYPGNEETAWARLTLGELYEKYSTTDAAAMQYQQILTEREHYPFAIAALANIELEKGNYEAAEEQLKKAAAIIPEFSFYQDLAKVYKKTKQEEAFDATVKELHIMLDDDIANGHNMTLEYAHLYHDLMEDPKEALKYALNEYEKRPNNIDVNSLLAAIYHDLGMEKEANIHLTNATKTNAKFPVLLALQQQFALK
jgi:tetratricopeptide (TPR) repeat protein